MASKSQQLRWTAESLFVREGKTLAEIAERLPVSQGALRRWSTEGKWMERRKDRQRESPEAALDVLKREREKMILEFGKTKDKDKEKEKDKDKDKDKGIRYLPGPEPPAMYA